MFNKDFYPTPEETIKKMFAPYYINRDVNIRFSEYYKLSNKSILEPSAGKGNILDWLSKNANNSELFAIEKEPELRSILESKNYEVLAEDFLEFESNKHFDLIVMNPPFSKGAEHLLKAWNLLKDGEIICLLNASTITNPADKYKKLICEIIKEFGNYEILENEFSNSERKTDVKIALVRLEKINEEYRKEFDFSGFECSDKDFNFTEENIKNEVAINDVFETYEQQYNNVNSLFSDYLKAHRKLSKAIDSFGGSGQHSIINFTKIAEEKNPRKALSLFDRNLKIIGWSSIFTKTNLYNLLTSEVKKNFTSFKKQKSSLLFNKKNIINLISTLYFNQGSFIQNSLCEVWEVLCSYDEKNKIHFEGWKTNDAFKVNKKVIIPYLINYGSYCSAYDLKNYGDRFRLNRKEILSDLDLVLCHLSGKKMTEINTISNAFDEHFKNLGNIRTGDKYENILNSEFFKIKFYKKGTTHFEFKDQQLLNFFNQSYAKNKNWIPNDYKSREKDNKAKSKMKTNKNKKSKKGLSELQNSLLELFNIAS